MNATTAVTLVVMTSASACKVGNIDHAEATFTQMESAETCEALAAQIDRKESVRAFCISDIK